MGPLAPLVTTIAGIGVALSHVILIGLLLGFLFARLDTKAALAKIPARTALWLGLFVSLGAVVGSLYYSEVVGLPVCDLCWWQRIAIYPQVILFGIALWKRDFNVWRYSVPLAGIGIVFAINHYLLQMTGIDALSTCGAVAGDADCATVYFTEFGYITFSMFGLTTLVLLVCCALLARWPERPTISVQE